MGAPAEMGDAVKGCQGARVPRCQSAGVPRCQGAGRSSLVAMSWITVLLWFSVAPAGAQNRYAVIVSGASGGQEYVVQYGRWCRDLSRALVDNFTFDPAAVTILSETGPPASAATAENVRRVLASLRQRMTREDLLIVVLIGHGTFDGVDAKFNLVGPDLESAEWAAALRPIPGRTVIVDTTSASFPFLERLAAPRRIVISATDSGESTRRPRTLPPASSIETNDQ